MRKIIISTALLLSFIVVQIAFSQPFATTSIPVAYRKHVKSPFETEQFKGKSIIVLAYSIDSPRASQAVRFLQNISLLKNENNFEVLGINLNAGRSDAVLQFNQQHGALFPIMIDEKGEIAKSLNIMGDLSLMIFNKKGEQIGSLSAMSIAKQRDIEQVFRIYVNKMLRLGFIPEDEPVLGDKPAVPQFEGEALNGDKIHIKQLYEKRPVVLVFFSPQCSHCRDELVFLNEISKNEFKDKIFIVAISRHNKAVTEKFVQEMGFTFPVLLDIGTPISSLFESFVGSVPMAYILDTKGRINARHTGFSDRMRDIYLMELRKLTGMKGKPLLNPTGYAGQERCAICHEKESMQWSLTKHPYALKSLQRKGKEDDPACVSCHVTGFNKPGGYTLGDKMDSKMLEGVQCESCHGPGYQSCSAYTGKKQNKKSAQQWKELCLTCHTEKESLNFNFSKRFPSVMHNAMPDIENMNREQRVKLMQEHKTRNDLFSNPAAYMGAESCKKCHEQEYAQWSQTAHARASESAAAQKAPADRQYLFNTGAPPGGQAPAGMRNVQCEACHGPGERHIKEPDKKGQNYIVGLGAECQSCVVEQICRSCHGPENDPKFNFDKYLEKVRHKPKQ